MKHSALKRLSNLYRRKVPPQMPVTLDLARAMTDLSIELGRGVSVLIDRRGRIMTVAVGDAQDTPLPPLAGEAESRLYGLRLVHTHLKPGGLSGNDLSMLFLNRLDAMIAVDAVPAHNGGGGSTVGKAQLATVSPPTSAEEDWIIDDPLPVFELEDENILERTAALEEELARSREAREVTRSSSERAVLVGLHTGETFDEASSRLEELAELTRSAGGVVVYSSLQSRPRPDPRTVVGRGKLQEFVSKAYHEDADLIIFDRELTPAQAREIDKETNLKVLDRTQLILDIFAQNARGYEAKVQVELAQLQYQLPRLAGRGEEMSRLGGGIGTRGPGETKLEVDRRRIRDRISALEKDVSQISQRRSETRKQRTRSAVPVIALVGYTNAGKSTLFNTITKSDVSSKSRLFETLRPTTREGWLPGLGEWGGKALFTDTVGFIRDLPSELLDAFRATLEELHDADYLLHVIDAATPGATDRIESVNRILDELELKPPRLVVINKSDITPESELRHLSAQYDAVAVSAVTREGIPELLEQLADVISRDQSAAVTAD